MQKYSEFLFIIMELRGNISTLTKKTTKKISIRICTFLMVMSSSVTIASDFTPSVIRDKKVKSHTSQAGFK